MKKRTIILKNIALSIFIIGGLVACNIDFASVDSDVINPDIATNFTTDFEEYPIITYNKKVGPVKTNGLTSYLLGYNSDPVYGTSTSNFVSQMTLASFNPTFGENVVLDSVVLTIPYFSELIETDSIGNSTYSLDSIFGNTPIKLSIFKNNFFLRDFNPDSEFNTKQSYFSNGSISSTSVINQSALEGQLLYENDQFLPDENQIRLTVIDTATNEPVVSTKLAPAIRIKLDNPNNNFWEDLIFNKEGEIELSNQNNFTDYFRGLYFKTEATDINGTLMMLNLGTVNSHLTLYYTSDSADTSTETTRIAKTVVLNFGGNQVNIFDNDFITIPDGDPINGDENLYLKGGEGSMAIINLFNGDADGNSPEFEEFKNKYIDQETGKLKRLVNEAFIEFFVNQNLIQGKEPERVYLFDLNNNFALIDYVLDQSTTSSTSKLEHLVPLERVDDDPNGEGIKYKIRITEHLNNLISRDSSNVKLGLVVTTNVASINLFEVQNDNAFLRALPEGAILSPRGTVLYGNNTTNTAKKATFKIFYTEPEN
jgi:hypothetical protein